MTFDLGVNKADSICDRVIKRKRTVECMCVSVHVWYCSLCMCYSHKRNVIGMCNACIRDGIWYYVL